MIIDRAGLMIMDLLRSFGHIHAKMLIMFMAHHHISTDANELRD